MSDYRQAATITNTHTQSAAITRAAKHGSNNAQGTKAAAATAEATAAGEVAEAAT